MTPEQFKQAAEQWRAARDECAVYEKDIEAATKKRDGAWARCEQWKNSLGKSVGANVRERAFRFDDDWGIVVRFQEKSDTPIINMFDAEGTLR